MSTITWPSGVSPDSFSLMLQTVQRSHASPFGGSEQVVDLLNDRWMVSMTLPLRSTDEAAAVEAWIASFRGMTNTINLYHWERPVPRGTMRGSPTCSAASQGAASIVLATGAVGVTLLAGDLISVSGLLLQVAANAVSNGAGAMTVTLVNRLRTAITGGAAVTWDHPTAVFRKISNPAQQYMPGYAGGVSLDFAEVI